VTAHLVSTALRDRRGSRGVLYVGERTSVFVITGGGRLLFDRRIDLGLESLAQALTRPIRAAGRDEPIELDIDAARSILHEHGIPGFDTVIEEAHGLTGAQVIPLIQPALQRFIVELRQSLRFGLAEDERDQLTIRLTGPGASLPGLGKLIRGELEIETEDEPGRTAYDFSRRSIDGSELVDALGDRSLPNRLNLQPFTLAHRRRVGKLRRWLWTGAAAALAVIAFDGFHYHTHLTDARRQADAIASRVADLEATKATSEKLVGMLQAMGDLEARIAEELGAPVDQRACLQELSRITPESIRFTSITFQRRDDATLATVTGYAFVASGDSGHTDLERFIESLGASPMFTDIVLGSVSVGVIDEREGQRFEATFTAEPGEPDGRFAAAEGGADQ
jgi:Tfp pilus assembly protein PilN